MINFNKNKNRLKHLLFLALGILFTSLTSYAQVVLQVGTGTGTQNTTGATPYGTFYEDGKVQYLITKAELNALNAVAGQVTSLAFNVTAVGNPAAGGYTIKLGHTTASSLSGYATLNGAFTTCYTSATAITPSLGWNTYTFTTPFGWNNIDNIVVEVCFDNAAWGANSGVESSTTTANTVYGTFMDGGTGCGAGSLSNVTAANTNRPNMRLGFYFPPSAPNNIGVFSIDSPTVFCNNTQNVYATVRNYGTNTVSSFNVNWSVNGVTQTPVSSTTVLDTNGTATNTTQVLLGSYNFTSGIQSLIKAWTSLPNNVADTANGNDSASVVRAPAMSGTFTIGGPVGATNFATFDAAIAAMQIGGVCGPVVFNVAAGTYTRTTAIVVPDVAGASAINTITFDGQNKNNCLITGSIASSGVVVLNNSKFVTFKNISITNTSTTTPVAVAIVGATTNITIRNVIARVPVLTGTSSTGYVINATGSANGSGVSGAPYNNLTIDSCRTVGGGYGIVTYGVQNATNNKNVVITNNTIDSCNYMGTYTYYNYNPLKINNNVINMQGWNYGYYGIYAYFNQSSDTTVSHEFMNNRINNFGGYGMYIYYPVATTTAAKVKIYNNVLFSNTNNSSYPGYYGIYIYNYNVACRADVYHNTVGMMGSGTSTSYTCFYSTGSNVINVKNNIFAVYAGSYTPMYLATSPAGNTVNNNNYYNATSPTANLLYRGAFYNSATYKTTTTGGDSSFNVAPSFTNRLATPYANLSLANGCDGFGTNLTADVPTDYTGATRSTANPNPGAYEFTGGAANNLAVQSLITPAAPIVAGAQDLVFKVKNIGNNTIYSYNASYKLNNNTPVTVAMTVNAVAPCMEDTAFFTSTNQITLGAVNNIAIYTDGPNASIDFDRTNDTLRNTFFAPLNGTYTVGGTTPDFATPAIAAAALSNGVSGPVVFDIRPGTYTDRVILTGAVAGISATNTVTFKGQNKATTIINGSFAGAMFLINQINYITVRDLTITNTSATTPVGIAVIGTSASTNGKGSKIINCNVNVPIQTGFSTTGSGIVFTATANGTGFSAMGADSVLVDSCTIDGGGYALSIYGSSNAAYNRGVVFTNNTLNNSNYMGGYIINNYNPLVFNYNTVNITSTTYGYYAVYMSSDQSSHATINHEIIGNRINGFNGYGLYITTPHAAAAAATAAKVKIYNNIIVSGFGNVNYPVYGGVYISSNVASNIDFFHNTVVMRGSVGSVSTNYAGLYSTGSSVILAKNNIFSVLSGVYYPASFGTSPTGNNVNYNIYYNAASANLVYRNATAYTAANYKTATAGGDTSFNMIPPINNSYIVSNGCFRGIQNLDVPTDIIGYTRSNSPNIGAYEYQGASLDLNAEAMPYPATPITLGAQNLAVLIRNNGTNTVTSFDVAYRLNNGTPVVYNWTGTLASCDTTTIVFSGANQITLGSTPNSIKVYTSNPNFSADGNPANDTISTTLNPPLNGTYVVGVAPSDFVTLNAAVAAIPARGVAGPVIFNIKTGTYNETLNLVNALGANATNTVTFKSQANHVDSVIISSATQQVVNFGATANYYVFDRVTLNQSSTTTSYYVVRMNGTASFDTIKNCKIKAPMYDGVTVTAAHYLVYATPYTGNGFGFYNNIFDGGYYQSYIWGSSRTAPLFNMVMNGNTFNNFYYAPINYFYYTNGLKITNNTFNQNPLASASNYMYHYYCDSGFTYTNNVWNGATGRNLYTYFYYTNNAPANKSIMANNRFAGSSLINYYVGQTGTNNQDIVHNSFATGTGYFYVGYVTTLQPSFRIMNNVFTATGSYAYYFSAAPSALYMTSDYNLVYVPGTTPYYAAAARTLPVMRTTYPGLERNSIHYLPAFTSATNLTPNAADTAVWAMNGRGTHLGYAFNDVNNVVRPLTPAAGVPDLGAYEVTPTAIAPLATAVPATPVAGTTQVFLFGTDTVAKITYDASANVPTAVGIRQYTGVRHPMAGANQNYTNVYNAATATGPGSYFFDYNMYYKDAMLGTNPSETDLRSARYANSFWSTYTSTASATDTVANMITSIGMSDFGDYIGTDNNTPLPVRLTAFGARANGKNALVSWTTASEKNANYFEVYASTDGRNFRAISQVRAAGNSNLTKNYSYNHMGALANANTVYYKLKSVDFDGTFTWSNIVSVSVNTRNNGVAIYPNPFNNNLTISVTETADATVEIFTLQGVSVYNNNHSAVNGTITLNNVSSLNNGVYFIKVTQNGNTTVEKLVKQ